MVDTQQPAALAIIGLFLGISTIFVCLRIYARVLAWKEDRTWDSYLLWSDALLFAAYVFAACDAAVTMKYTLYTWQGYHLKDIPKLSIEDQVRGQKFNLANQLLYNPILALVKASIIMFLLRIGAAKPLAKVALWIAMGINIALAIAILFADAFQCSPFRYVYDYPAMDKAAQIAAGADAKGMLDGVVVKGGTCINQINFFLISAGMTVGTDLLVVAIPTYIVWGLQIARKRKIVIASVLSCGVIVTAISVARLVIYHWRFSPDNHDRTYGVGYTVSFIESNMAVSTACMISLGPLARSVAPKIFGSSNMGRSTRPTPTGYIQSRDARNDEYTLSSKVTNWKGSRNRVEAWSSDENIILTGPSEIRRNVNVDLTFSEATSVEGASVNEGNHSKKASF